MASLNRKIHILLVEDNEDTCEMLSLTLAEYRLTIARNFAEGLSQARQRYFDLYILDNWLPDGSGIELCHLIREFDPHAPIVFYSAAAYPHDIEEAMSVGAKSYLVKPVTFDELTRTVSKLISDARAVVFDAKRAELAAIKEELLSH